MMPKRPPKNRRRWPTEVDVAQDAVLRDMEADRDRGGVAVADLEVDVRHRRVERRLVRAGDRVVRGHQAGRRERHARRTPLATRAAAGARVREVDHHAEPGLEAVSPLR
jgi:hypothetical protein